MTLLPPAGGSYLLQLHLNEGIRLAPGRLPEADFPAGDYLYAGSAFGPGGLRARLGRHLHGSPNRHWHIDYLRAWASVTGAGYIIELIRPAPQARLECLWSQTLAQLPGATIPLAGFGASDCPNRCPAHLVQLPHALTDERDTAQSISAWILNWSALPSANEITWYGGEPAGPVR